MKTIALHAKLNKLPSWPREKIEAGEYPEGLTSHMEHTTDGEYSWPVYTYPELGPKRLLSNVNAFVADIAGRRWIITINGTSDGRSVPEPVDVVFREIEAEETPPSVGPRVESYAFGQPTFIQNPVFPHYNGRSACLLACIESGWGDAGNENIFVGLDDDGYPVGLYHEYSCC